MLAVNFEGAREIGKPVNMTDEECGGLPIFQAITSEKDGTPQFVMAGELIEGPPYPFTLTHWKPSKEDLEALNAGRGFWVRFLTHKVYPMAIFTTDPMGQINQ